MFTPPRLESFLDYGGDLGLFAGLEGLAEAVIVSRRLNSRAQNATQAAFYRQCVARWVTDGPNALRGHAWLGVAVTQPLVTAFSWAADCFEDDALAERFERTIPVEVYLENIQWATERRARASS